MNTKQITIDVELSRVIEANRVTFQETECQILRRLLLSKSTENTQPAKSINSFNLSKELPEGSEFYIQSPLHKKDVNAGGRNSANGFIVLKGSRISKEVTAGMPDYYDLVRTRLENEGVIDKNTRLFTRDYEFSAKSAASSVVLGVSSNGKLAWVPLQ